MSNIYSAKESMSKVKFDANLFYLNGLDGCLEEDEKEN